MSTAAADAADAARRAELEAIAAVMGGSSDDDSDDDDDDRPNADDASPPVFAAQAPLPPPHPAAGAPRAPEPSPGSSGTMLGRLSTWRSGAAAAASSAAVAATVAAGRSGARARAIGLVRQVSGVGGGETGSHPSSPSLSDASEVSDAPEASDDGEQDGSSGLGGFGDSITIEEEDPDEQAEATAGGKSSARWLSARRTALDSVSSVATGFRGRYAAASSSSAAAGSTSVRDGKDGSIGGDLAAVTDTLSVDSGASSMSLSQATPRLVTGPGHQDEQQQQQQQQQLPAPHPQRTAREEEMFRALSSPQGATLAPVLKALGPGAYPMVLGRGMFGVNLRQTYGTGQSSSGSRGVYVDFMIPRGNADRSGVVGVGDLLLRVGKRDVSRGSTGDIPRIIADAKRPVVLVLSEGKGLGEGGDGMDWVDASIGLINGLAADDADYEEANDDHGTEPGGGNGGDDNNLGPSGPGLTSSSAMASLMDQEGSDSEIKAGTDGESHGDADADKDGKGLGENVQQVHEGSFVYNNVPNLDVTTPSFPFPSMQNELARKASMRANPNGSISVGTISALLEDEEEGEEKSNEASSVTQMKDAFHKALVYVCLDPRRSEFLSLHLAREDHRVSEAREEAARDMGLPPSDVDYVLDKRNASAPLLEYYLKMLAYLDIAGTVPPHKRPEMMTNLLEAFRDLSASNLLTTDPDTLAETKTLLDNLLMKSSKDGVDSMALEKLRGMVGRSLSVCPQFVTFLLSDQCARMRGYLHATSPFVTVPLAVMLSSAISLRHNPIPSLLASQAHNHLIFSMLHLLCRSEISEETDDDNSGQVSKALDQKRIPGSAGGISCALFIEGTLLSQINDAEVALGHNDNDEGDNTCFLSLIRSFEYFWETFIAPAGGIIESSNCSDPETIRSPLNAVQRTLVSIVTVVDGPHGENPQGKFTSDRILKVARGIVESTELKSSLQTLSAELVHEYATFVRPDFRRHLFHEWMCEEVHRWNKKQIQPLSPEFDTVLENGIYPMAENSITRLMRRVELPKGISQHRPQNFAKKSSASDSDLPEETANRIANAEYAIVFGTDDGMDSTGRMPDSAAGSNIVRRFASVGFRKGSECSLDEDAIPPNLETYASVPSIGDLPFSEIIDNGRVSADGWEISLFNFMVPHTHSITENEDANGDGKFIHGVSLVLRQIFEEEDPAEDCEVQESDPSSCITELVHIDDETDMKSSSSNLVTPSKGASQVSFQSPISVSRSDTGVDDVIRKIRVSAKTPEFNRCLREIRWSERVKKRKQSGGPGAMIGIALISGKNVIPAMRDTLSKLYDDYTNIGGTNRLCNLLVDILGTLSQNSVEGEALNCILEPYIDFGSSNWMSGPMRSQKDAFAARSGSQLIQSLPPIPLALLFITALLEQKIIISSRRRSLIVSVTTALRSMLNPLSWAHLFVPLVPASLARDLIHYPAPFILGVPSESEDSMSLLNSLPADITLVDLDVGRVILAGSLANAEGTSAGALRSQVLFLAETLGSAFGCKMQDSTWRCDSPLTSFTSLRRGHLLSPTGGDLRSRSFSFEYDAVVQVCQEFITELLCGARSCSYWVEEKVPDEEAVDIHECSVLFDEERFFSLKSLRAEDRYMPLFMGQDICGRLGNNAAQLLDGPISRNTGLSLNPADFDLVLQLFLRCQGMSTHISSLPKQAMVFW